MGFSDKDGQPLIKWRDPESAFEAWKVCSKGRPCDYSGITYERLRSGGIQWPCNEEHPDGTERLYEDGRFYSDADYCEEYGRDLLTGAQNPAQEYLLMNPAGRAILKAARYVPPHEEPDDEYSLSLNTGRTVYQWHTRTKTARVRQLQRAAPEVWAELSAADGEKLGIREGDLVRVSSRRGFVDARARITHAAPGSVFVPFHYGNWDDKGAAPNGSGKAANELTFTAWDPVSKQPLFKSGAVRVEKLADGNGTPAPAPTTTASAPVDIEAIPATVGGEDAEAASRVEA
jgi:predicted molibdopterin-dependent oxidoreductase YjgC